MPYKLYAYWSAPKEEDVEEFERYYAETHVPRASAVPNLIAINTTRTADGFEGGATDHYRVAEMVFDTAAAMAESEGSEEWATMRPAPATSSSASGSSCGSSPATSSRGNRRPAEALQW